jgi:hypothetical protein
MLYAIGTKVRLRYTGETGVVTKVLDEDLLEVRLNDGEGTEIPAFMEDLELDISAMPTVPGARVIPGKQPAPPQAPPRREIKSQYVVLKPKGLQLCFEPMPGKDGSVSRFKAWLINDTVFEFLIDFILFAGDKRLIDSEDICSAMSAIELGDIRADDLNELPEADLEVRRITTAGPDEPLHRVLKIKPKQFFNRIQTVPILNQQAYNFVMLDRFEPQPANDAAKEDLRDYTRQRVGNRPRRSAGSGNNSKPYKPFDIEAFSTFVPEIDLHAEMLIAGHHRLDKGEILRLQLQHCDRFLDQAVRLGVHHVFLIHGIGEGKLRDAIKNMLRNRPNVVRFKNEYHPKYGYGATEVTLR